MPKKYQNNLHCFVDILIANEIINLATQNYSTFEELEKNIFYWNTIARQIEIISEATANLMEILDNKKYVNIINFRNTIVHEYLGTTGIDVWEFIKNDLPQYINELKLFLQENNIDLQNDILQSKEKYIYKKHPEIIVFLDELSQELYLNKEIKKRKVKR